MWWRVVGVSWWVVFSYSLTRAQATLCALHDVWWHLCKVVPWTYYRWQRDQFQSRSWELNFMYCPIPIQKLSLYFNWYITCLGREEPDEVRPVHTPTRKRPASSSIRKASEPRKRQNSGIEFPPCSELVGVPIVGQETVFTWPGRMLDRAKQSRLGISHRNFAGYNLCTEFSGSGCPEATLCSIVSNADLDMDVKCQYSADVDSTCRKVLSSSCEGLIFELWLRTHTDSV